MNKQKYTLTKSPDAVNAAGDFSSDSILVIDSGVGGLSICQSILAQQPSLQIVYFADSAYFPYGLLAEDKLSERLKIIVARMLKLHQPKLVVLACNTVSTLVLPELRAMFDIPFVGVVPAIKPAASISQTKRIGLLATPATVVRPYTEQLIKDYASSCEVVKVGSSELVIQAENLLNDEFVDMSLIDSVLEPFKTSSVDTIVLGCTHFPLLKDHLNQILPDVTWVDSGNAIANRVTYLLAGNRDENMEEATTEYAARSHELYFSTPIHHRCAFSNALEYLGFNSFRLHYLEAI